MNRLISENIPLNYIENIARSSLNQAFISNQEIQRIKEQNKMDIRWAYATPEMSEELTQFAIDSNANYNYRNVSEEIIKSVFLTREEDILNGIVGLMQIEGETIGFYTLRNIFDENGREINELEALFLRPDYIGKGYGRLLFDKAVMDAKNLLGWTYFQLESDPFAAKFYEKLGAVKIKTNPCPLNSDYETTVFIYTF